MKTSPEEYAYIIMPMQNNTHRKRDILSFEMITRCYNLKVKLVGSRKEGI